jgi:hypothetical protein
VELVFSRVDVGSIDRLVWWGVTYCVGCRSADIWGYVHLCVVLERNVYDGGMIGCIVAHMVMIVWLYQIFFSRVMVLLIGPHSCLLFRMCSAYANWGSLCFMYLMRSWYLCFKLRFVCPMYDV